MFADCLLESSWRQRTRRGWTTLSSFGLQAAVMGILLLLPLIRPIALPFLQPLAAPIALAVPHGLPPAQPLQHSTQITQSNMNNNILIAPSETPNHVLNVDETVAPPQIVAGGEFVPGATGSGDPHGILSGLGNAPVAMPAPPPPVASHLRVSRMMEGNLIRRVQPEYPATAKMAHVQGRVVLSAVISKEGTIEKVQVLSGHPLLVPAAVEAVKQWRYRPYVLNDEPVEVETQITVNFLLGRS
ncbi:MAG TPA: energy transducer TonB [Candidatus Sulfotelmatobacter sp.]